MLYFSCLLASLICPAHARPPGLARASESTLVLFAAVLLYCVSSLVNDLVSAPRDDPSRLDLSTRFPNGIAKVLLFLFPPNFFYTFFRFFLHNNVPKQSNYLNIKRFQVQKNLTLEPLFLKVFKNLLLCLLTPIIRTESSLQFPP